MSGMVALVLLLADASQGWQRGPGLSLRRGEWLKVALVGYLQLDGRAFGDWGAEEVERAEAFELRRLRVGLEADLSRLHLEAQVDPADGGEELKDLYAELRFGKALRVRAGHSKLPVSPEFLTSAARLDFPERSMIAEALGPARDWGLLVHGEPWRRLAFQAGVFAGDGDGKAWRSGSTVAGRLVVTPLPGVDVGVSSSRASVEADPVAPGASPHGLEGQTPSGWEFSSRRFVEGTRFRLGADAAWRHGPLGLRAEWLRCREERRGQGSLQDDLPAEIGAGFAVSATLLATGEKKKGTIEPRRPLLRGPGALELGLRYESLRFDDDGPDSGFAGLGSRSRNIRPVAARALTGSVSWWPHALLRAQAAVIAEHHADALVAPEPGRHGAYLTFLGRLQLRLP